MKVLDYLKICLLCIMTLPLCSCGDDEDTPSLDDKLCRTWMQETVIDNITYTHKLKFVRKGNSGQEIKMEYDTNTATSNTETRDFTWQWKDGAKECLVLNYGAGETKYLENVWVREHYLTGLLNGEIIMMADEGYR